MPFTVLSRHAGLERRVFVDNQVSTQLSAQEIVFPTKSNAEFKALPAAGQAAMGQYAGQQMTTGAQAKGFYRPFLSSGFISA
jgi:hypothetical protein